MRHWELTLVWGKRECGVGGVRRAQSACRGCRGRGGIFSEHPVPWACLQKGCCAAQCPEMPLLVSDWQKMDFCSTVHGNCGVGQARLWGWWDPIPGKSEVLGHWRLWDLVPGCLQCPHREDVSGTLCQARLFCHCPGGRRMSRLLWGISPRTGAWSGNWFSSSQDI